MQAPISNPTRIIILTRISLTDPTKELHFEYYLADDNSDNLSRKIREIEEKVVRKNVKEYDGPLEKAPYKVGYVNPKANQDRIAGVMVPWVFLVEEHTSYDFAFAISVRKIKNGKAKLTFFEH